jgi:hypothetical protein
MTNPISSADAVALVEKHSGGTEYWIDLPALLTDHSQQVIEELAQASGVMPEVLGYLSSWPNHPPTFSAYATSNSIKVCSLDACTQAIATMQAKLWMEQQAADKFEGLMIDAQLRVDEHLKDKVALGARAEYWHLIADDRTAEIVRLMAQLQEDTARHVRFVLGEHAEVCTERDKLLARVVDLEKDRNDFAKYIARETPLGADDWACSRCHQNSEILKSGFVCDAHRAIDIDAAMKGASHEQ